MRCLYMVGAHQGLLEPGLRGCEVLYNLVALFNRVPDFHYKCGHNVDVHLL